MQGIIATDSVSGQEIPQYIAKLTKNRRNLPIGETIQTETLEYAELGL
tara:strand:- start:795 stop:938 length:144 start_codon:yes stop_codon:yes gene_type:complete